MHRRFGRIPLAAVALLVAGLAAGAAEAATHAQRAAEDSLLAQPPPAITGDPKDLSRAYLGWQLRWAPDVCAPALANWSEDSADPVKWRPVVLEAPLEAEPLVVEAPLGAVPSVLPAFFAYPKVTGLADYRKDERAVPLGQTEALALGPSGFGRVLVGRPDRATQVWAHAGETAISYIRPHVNLQMLLALEMPGGDDGAEFEGPGFRSNARLTVEHRTRVDSADIGSASEQFGLRPAPMPVDEPQTALVVGLDLGLMPTFLAQMGMNVSVVASRGRESGDVTVALVGTTELPVDWLPPEEPRQHPVGLPVNPLEAPYAAPWPFFSALVSGGAPELIEFPFPRPPRRQPIMPIRPTPIIPVIPEPATLALMAAGLAASLAARRRRAR